MRSSIHKLFCSPILLAAVACGGGDDLGSVTQFRGDAARTGVARTVGVAAPGGVRWRFRTEGPVRSTPAVAGERLYVGSADGRLYALEVADGTPAWTFEADGPIDSSPAVAGERVFFVSRPGTLYAVERGVEVWRVETGGPAPLAWGFESGDVYTSSPLVVDGWVVFGAPDGGIYAVDADDGAVEWSHPTGGRVRSSPAFAGGRVFVGSMDGSLYAVELASGRLAWRFDTEGRRLDSARFGFDRRTIQSSPAVVDGVVYVGSRDGHVYAVGADDGEVRWRFDHEVSWAISSPAVHDGLVYTGSSDARFFHAIEAATGREAWRVPTESAVWSSPLVVGSTVYFATTRGTVVAADRTTGEERWRWGAGGAIFGSPVVADGALYVGDSKGWIHALGAGAPPILAVYWDDSLEAVSSVPRSAELRDHLAARGYRVLDADSLVAFLEARAADGAPSAIVFAIDQVPAAAAPQGSGALSPIRRYLDADGKVVWLGRPPLVWPLDPKSGEIRYDRIDRAAPAAVTGVDHGKANFDAWGARPTEEGRRWGLAGWWQSRWSVDPSGVTTVLATDENGLAAAWVRRFNGPPGTGFVRFDGWGAGAQVEPATVAALAEFRGTGTRTPAADLARRRR